MQYFLAHAGLYRNGLFGGAGQPFFASQGAFHDDYFFLVMQFVERTSSLAKETGRVSDRPRPASGIYPVLFIL